jgi:hypothetical protein
MAKFLSVLWVAAVSFAMCLALLLFTGLLWRLSHFGFPATSLPSFVGSILLSGVTVLYSAAELWSRSFKRRPFLPRIGVAPVTLLGLATSLLLAPVGRRSAETRIINISAEEWAHINEEVLARALDELNKAKDEDAKSYWLGEVANASFAADKLDDA